MYEFEGPNDVQFIGTADAINDTTYTITVSDMTDDPEGVLAINIETYNLKAFFETFFVFSLKQFTFILHCIINQII